MKKIIVVVLIAGILFGGLYGIYNKPINPHYPNDKTIYAVLWGFGMYFITIWLSPVWDLPEELEKTYKKYPDITVSFCLTHWGWMYDYPVFIDKNGEERSMVSDNFFHHILYFYGGKKEIIPTPWGKRRAMIGAITFVGVESGMLPEGYQKVK